MLIAASPLIAAIKVFQHTTLIVVPLTVNGSLPACPDAINMVFLTISFS